MTIKTTRKRQLELMRRRLDGELAPGSAEARELDALCRDPARAAELAALERLARELGALRTAPASRALSEADFVANVMRALPSRVPARRSALGWLTRPFAIRITPALALAGLGILVATGVLISRLATPRPTSRAASAKLPMPMPVPAPAAPGLSPALPSGPDPASQLIEVRFMLSAPGAHVVTLVGDFNDWRSDDLTLSDPDQDGVWTLTVPLPPGRHAYQFVIDGEGRPDPNASAVPDGFGGQNSVLTI